jgi:phospholipase C
MDGFAKRMGVNSMGYFEREDIPLYWWMADQFTLCDHWFCSLMGPTTPNRYYSMTGTIDPAGLAGGPAKDNSVMNVSWETYPERLSAAGVSWRVYHEEDDFEDNCLKIFKKFRDAAPGSELHEAAMVNRTVEQFAADVASGNLPQVSWIVAPTLKSEHPPFPPAEGEAWMTGYLNALMTSPAMWAKTAFILSFDENGGFFDHVAPPVAPAGTADEYLGADPIGLGFRVPGLILSPWSRGERSCRRLWITPPRCSSSKHVSGLRSRTSRSGAAKPAATSPQHSTFRRRQTSRSSRCPTRANTSKKSRQASTRWSTANRHLLR